MAFWEQFLRGNLRLLGGWLVTGIGGFVGVIGSADDLPLVRVLLAPDPVGMDRSAASNSLFPGSATATRQSGTSSKHDFLIWGIRRDGFDLWRDRDRHGSLADRSTPAFLWGVLFGMLEFVPYFGPMVGGTLLTLVALTTGEGSWWQPLTMLGVILAWLTLEGYVIAPMVYGRAVRFDPVMVLVAILFFGWLWGPLGMVTALPVMVMLRELASISPETPALDALMEPQPSNTTAHASH